MTTAEEGIGRLRLLLAHMEAGQMAAGGFRMDRWAGCMGGELPVVFPLEWEWVAGEPELKELQWGTAAIRMPFTTHAQWWFGLRYEEVVALFYPYVDHLNQCPAGRVRVNAKRAEVADNLRRFIEGKEAALRQWVMSEEGEKWREFGRQESRNNETRIARM